MALTAEQQAILESRLPLHHVAKGADQPLSIALSGRELRFVLQAIAHFRDVGCAIEGQNEECALVCWYESPQGHIERSCESFCDRLIDRMLAQIPARR